MFRGGIMRAFRHLAVLLTAITFLGCDSAVESPPPAPDLSFSHLPHLDPSSAIGAGVFSLGGTVPTEFSFLSLQLRDAGPATGYVQFYTKDACFVYDIQGRITCMAVDAVNHRAWMAGVV